MYSLPHGRILTLGSFDFSVNDFRKLIYFCIIEELPTEEDAIVNSNDYSLLAPGPVNLHPEVLKILSQPMIHHRTPEFDGILKTCLANLKKVFFTDQPAYILSSTGSGGMEALLVNTLNPGEKVLCVVSGKFGERWADMAEVFGAEVTRIHVPWGESVSLEVFEKNLRSQSYSAVITQACETSTAVAHPIEALSQLIRKYQDENCLFLVDGITALGAYPLPMEDCQIDGLVGGSQKAFMLPTGLSFVCFSKRAWKKIELVKTPRFYFDIRKERDANSKGETFFSSSVAHIRALDWVLKDLMTRGFQKHFQDIANRAQFTREFAQRLGLGLYSKSPSNSLTAVNIPEGLDGQKIRSRLESEFKITVMGGQDQLKGKILRIGHMGYIQKDEMNRFMTSLAQVLHSEGFSAPTLSQEDFSNWWKDRE